MKILCVIPTLPSELKRETLVSIANQTVPVNYFYVLTKRFFDCFLPQKVSAVLNDGVSGLRLEYFDYLLRLDGDTVLPSDFVEKHLALGVDVAGGAGYAQLIKVSFFLKKMNGQFNSLSDDSYSYFKAKNCGSSSLLVQPVIHRKSGATHSKMKCQFYTGQLDYFIGHTPICALIWLRPRSLNLMRFLGYFYCLFTFQRGFEFANVERKRYLVSMFQLIFRRLKV